MPNATPQPLPQRRPPQLRRAFLLVAVLTSCAARPPREAGNFRPSELVELTTLDPTIRLDIRYATAQNLLHRPVYAQARAFLQRPAAEALVAVHQSLRPLGYGLLVFDGYRPWRVTKLFWDATPRADRQFVANPAKGSRHNRGCAIDLSLYALATGQEVAMPGAYDEMGPRSAARYAGGTPEQRALRDLLRRKMEHHGFAVLPAEWWHFDYQDWKLYGIQNTPFNKL